MKKKLILASQSPRRREILKQFGFKFDVLISNVKEHSKKKRPSAIVKDLAFIKAKDVSTKINKGIILGADTIVYCDKEIIGKPKNLKDAKRILNKITNHVNYVYTGLVLIDLETKRVLKDYEVTKVYMREFKDIEIDKFAKKHLDKAGAYGIQDKNDKMVKLIKGDYYNVVGLPIETLKIMLKEIGYYCLSKKV